MVYQEEVKNEALILLLKHEVVLKVVLRSGLRERFYRGVTLSPGDVLKKMRCVNQVTTRPDDLADNDRSRQSRFTRGGWANRYHDTVERKLSCTSLSGQF